ncbi:hypothetical protein GAY29_08080 [Azospirillum brasilense]|uniref:hypothetical protein n=1 Tax=Azospirillum brasilense TaxID=192 RepID=UPI00190BEE50|nr:hypothetical protein [Azospirillum brasilense]MBK3733068.1 hypothetical protein [Azospirillum brasilense]
MPLDLGDRVFGERRQRLGGRAVCACTDMPWIIAPLGMDDTGFSVRDPSRLAKVYADGRGCFQPMSGTPSTSRTGATGRRSCAVRPPEGAEANARPWRWRFLSEANRTASSGCYIRL